MVVQFRNDHIVQFVACGTSRCVFLILCIVPFLVGASQLRVLKVALRTQAIRTAMTLFRCPSALRSTAHLLGRYTTVSALDHGIIVSAYFFEFRRSVKAHGMAHIVTLVPCHLISAIADQEMCDVL